MESALVDVLKFFIQRHRPSYSTLIKADTRVLLNYDPTELQTAGYLTEPIFIQNPEYFQH